MNPTASQEITGKVRDLLTDLRISDQETDGRPRLPLDRVPFAREWLARVLVDGRPLVAHLALLQELYGAKFRTPEPRRFRPEGGRPPVQPPAGFRHNQLLPEETAQAIVERGPEVLTDDELAPLLLNPLALSDVADLVNALLPAYWLPRMEEVGRQLIAEYDLALAVPRPTTDSSGRKRKTARRRPKRERELALVRGRAGVEAGEAGAWNLLFSDEAAQALAHRIAEHAYGDPARVFTLRLHRLAVEGQRDLVQAAVELSPAPTKNDVLLVINFREGGERTFTLEVPPDVKLDPEAEPRERTRSELCAPLPAAAFDFQGGSEWRDDAWPPHLVLRSGKRNRNRVGQLGQQVPASAPALERVLNMISLQHPLSLLPDRLMALVVKEMGDWTRLTTQFPDLFRPCKGPFREGHVQGLLLSGLRPSGYGTLAETNYLGKRSRRKLDLAILLPDAMQWLFLEIKGCTTKRGFPSVLADAEKLVAEDQPDLRNQLRGLLVYGFGSPRYACSSRLYQELSDKLKGKGFHEIGIRRQQLEGTEFTHVQMGLWILLG
jgi:hypothetical protein